MGGVFGLGSRYRHNFDAAKAEGDQKQCRRHPRPPIRQEPTVTKKIGRSRRGSRQDAADKQHTDDEEDDDGDHLEQGKPELKLPEAVGSQQVDRGENDQEDEGKQPDGGYGPHGDKGRRRCDRLGRYNDDEFDPPDPPHCETGSRAHSSRCIDRKRPRVGVGCNHFAEHVHDGDDEQPSDDISHQGCWSGRSHTLARPYEETGPDGRTEAHHHQMTALHAGFIRSGFTGSHRDACGRYCHMCSSSASVRPPPWALARWCKPTFSRTA